MNKLGLINRIFHKKKDGSTMWLFGIFIVFCLFLYFIISFWEYKISLMNQKSQNLILEISEAGLLYDYPQYSLTKNVELNPDLVYEYADQILQLKGYEKVNSNTYRRPNDSALIFKEITIDQINVYSLYKNFNTTNYITKTKMSFVDDLLVKETSDISVGDKDDLTDAIINNGAISIQMTYTVDTPYYDHSANEKFSLHDTTFTKVKTTQIKQN